MSPRTGRGFWVTIDRISKQGNGVVETADGRQFIVGPVKEEAVAQRVRVRMVGPGRAELLDPDIRKDVYAQSADPDTEPLYVGAVLTGRLMKRTKDGVPVLEQEEYRIHVPDGELNEVVTVEIVEFLKNTPSWKGARAKRVSGENAPESPRLVIEEIELFETLTTHSTGACQCPVEGCTYSGAVASVAGHVSGKNDSKHSWPRLGYNGANQFKREMAKREPTPIQGETSVLHVSDSHLGASLTNVSEYSTDNGCLGGFKQAITVGVERDVDGILHTGDLFHNDRNGIPEPVVEATRQELRRLRNADIPFYIIEGNHERKEGRSVLTTLKKQALVIPLSETPQRVGDGIQLYGRNYATKKEWQRGSWTPGQFDTDRIGILAVHQSIAPVSSSDYPECSIAEVVSMAKPHIQVVAAGHLHSYQIHWEDGIPFVFSDATEPTRADGRVGPGVGCFHQRGDSLQYQRISIQMSG